MRASRHEKATTPAAPANAAHDIDFGHLWRQMKAAGWTSKRPTGIQTEWTYASPTDDVLAGERAVAEFAFKTGLLVAGEDDSVEAGADDADKRDGHGGTDDASEHDGHGGTDDAAECDRHGGADDAPEHIGHGGTDDAAEHDGHGEGGTDDATIRPSQIDTSVLLLQNTVEQVVGSDSDASGVELSQNAVAKVLDLSQRDLHAEEGQCDAAASFHLLSEPSGQESEREDERAVAPSAAPPRRHQIPAQPTADVNVLQNWENSCDYDELSSGDESDGAAVVDDYRDSGGESMGEGGGDELSDSDAEEIDQSFLASLHVGDGGLSRADLEERENTVRAKKARPVGQLLDLWRSPLLTLFYFLPKSLLGLDCHRDQSLLLATSCPTSRKDGCAAVRAPAGDRSPNSSSVEGKGRLRRTRGATCSWASGGTYAVPPEAALRRALVNGRGRRHTCRTLRAVHEP
ncbi:hypothetical protein F443_09069 [Phytophthora nicotianae P1569]|uniref:Uncharacterized protein n=1 Tax=Phytophthora nicotianae P1569 TaxID=1317065 RepID=V9F808_PHYNI|nr:hypothetical protein F443_09069 [Phytophthora nicotianae P1569]